MFNLADYVRSRFAGMLVIGDLHADFPALERATEYAREHNLFLMSLGDLVDRKEWPYECVNFFRITMDEGKAGLTVGNHDDKYRRLALGNKVSLSNDQTQTLIDVGHDRREEFLSMYSDIQTREGVSGIFHTFDDLLLVHAASHPDMWSSTGKFGSEARSRAMYGEVTGETEPDGMPIRFYNWVNEIPAGKTVLVGHDRKPVYNVAITEPLVLNGTQGGRAVFIDTGCGKGGFLTGAVVTATKRRFTIAHYVKFKEDDANF